MDICVLCYCTIERKKKHVIYKNVQIRTIKSLKPFESTEHLKKWTLVSYVVVLSKEKRNVLFKN